MPNPADPMDADCFIADLHLSPQRPDITATFLQFLRTLAGRVRALYILGDLFDAWIGDDAPDPMEQGVIRGLRTLSDAGVCLYLMHGNRDFLLAEGFAAQTGVELLADPAVRDLHGVPTLLMHGDLLCTDDLEYQALRRQLRSPQWARQMLALPPAERRRLAAGYRQRSRERIAAKQEAIMDVNQDSVARAMAERRALRLIHGHTHRPGLHRFDLAGRPAERYVLGAWYRRANALFCDRHGCRRRSWELNYHPSQR